MTGRKEVIKMTNRKATKSGAMSILQAWRKETAYFDSKDQIFRLTTDDMERCFREKGFGEAESKVIVAALILAGADFAE